jgi:hypothetical protein
MNEQLFDEQASKTRLTERSRAMARAILVDGRTPAEVGSEYGVSRQRAADAARRVVDAADRNREIPADWQRVTVRVHPGLVKVVRYLERMARFRAGLGPEPEAQQLRQDDIQTIAEMMRRWAKQIPIDEPKL